MKILTLDIETSPHTVYTWGLFDQTVGINQIEEPSRVICFAAKWKTDREVMFFRGDGMVKAAHDLLSECDALVTWNGDSFDIPHLNREFLLAGLDAPAPYASLDLIKTVRRYFKFASNKLDYVTQTLGLGAKLHNPGFTLWKGCMAGDPKAWKLMERYNKGDVVITEKDYDRVMSWIPNHPNPSLIDNTDNPHVVKCPVCTSFKVERRGYAYTKISATPRYHCLRCGKWFRTGARLFGVQER